MATILAAKQDSVEATLGQEITWQMALKRAIRSGLQLCDRVQVAAEAAVPAAEADFPVFAPLEYVARMRMGDAGDPLLRQVLAVPDELEPDPLGKIDPVGDRSAERTPGLLQKYQGRALLVTSGACAVHCRYCFRRHYPYSEAPTGPAGWQPAIDSLAADRSLSELILSGGDPLTLTNHSLRWLVEAVNSIPHVRRLRVHTRLPVVIPQHVDSGLLECLRASRAAVYCVLHFNHPQEIDDPVRSALHRLRASGVTLLNQAVLLRGVNDEFSALRELCGQLADLQVLPYYLHQLDPVLGARHFEVSDARALELITQLRSSLPGYAVPRLARETEGQPSKTVLA